MADTTGLKVMSIFEAGARLNTNSEITCLAAYLYHKFIYHKGTEQLDTFAYTTAALGLAYKFHDKHMSTKRLILATISLIHGPEFYIEPMVLKKMLHTVNLASAIISNDLQYYLNYKDEHRIGPQQLNRLRKDGHQASAVSRQKVYDSSGDEVSSEDEDPIPADDKILRNNCKYSISSHRYLLHYLKSIKTILAPNCPKTSKMFEEISNTAWMILCDYHWFPKVTRVRANHLACACLMMAIETYRDKLENSKSAISSELWRQLKRKWHLILCDNFNDVMKDRIIDDIVLSYADYESLMQHELNLVVVDSSCNND